MCGLIGFSGKEGQKYNPKTVAMLFAMNQLRGIDSWGHAHLVEKDKGAYEHSYSRKVGRVLNDINSLGLVPSANFLGHVRAKTKGEVNLANAHPFAFKGKEAVVTGAHNGTIENILDISRYYNDKLIKESNFVYHPVDSMWIFYSMAKFSNHDLLSKIKGGTAFIALVEKSMRVYNNGGRTLYSGEAEEGLYFSSEEEPLKFFNMKNIKEVPLNEVHTIENGEYKSSISIERNEKFTYSGKKKEENSSKTRTNSTKHAYLRTTKIMNKTDEKIASLEKEGKTVLVAVKHRLAWHNGMWKNKWTGDKINESMIFTDSKMSLEDGFNLFGTYDHMVEDDEKHNQNCAIVPMRPRYRIPESGFYFLEHSNAEDEGLFEALEVKKFHVNRVVERIEEVITSYDMKKESPGRRLVYENGTNAAMTNSFSRHHTPVAERFCFYSPDTDGGQFLLCTHYKDGSYIEEVIENFSDLFGLTKAGYLNTYGSNASMVTAEQDLLSNPKNEESVKYKMCNNTKALLYDLHAKVDAVLEDTRVINEVNTNGDEDIPEEFDIEGLTEIEVSLSKILIEDIITVDET